VVGVEDGGFSRESLDGSIQKALLLSVLMRKTWVEEIRATTITVDGLDATNRLCDMLKGWSFDAVMLAGVSFAGFNLIDPRAVYQEYEKPVIVISRTQPDNVAVRNALIRHFEDWKTRWSIFDKLGQIHKVVSMINEPPIYVEMVGAELNWTKTLVRATSVCCRVPEPVRVARLIAHGLTRLAR